MKRLVTSPVILMPLIKRLPLVFAGALSVGLLTSEAGASQQYPATLKAATDASVAPPCNICHQSAGGGDTITGAFGKAMKAEGLTGGSAFKAEDAMKGLLDKLGDTTDSDKGGQPDIAELAAGKNPSDPDDDGGGASGSGGGGGGGNSAGGGTRAGRGGSGNTGGDGDDDNAGKQDQATSAGCSYGSLDGSSRAGSLAILTGADLAVSSFTRRRKRR